MSTIERVEVKPKLLRWARERAGLKLSDLSARFPKIRDWESGAESPTFKQLEKFAHATHVPLGFLFLSKPPDEPLPIPDFRTIAGSAIPRPSANLLDTIYACQMRQDWYRDFAESVRLPALPFVGSASVRTRPERVADEMRKLLGFDLEARRSCTTWTDALRQFIAKSEQAGILVMVNGVVVNNTHRKLDPEEFRGFALADHLAPLVFINGADTKAAQMFTLAHELAHLWLGNSALTNSITAADPALPQEEAWCNQVAAEFLVPQDAVRRELKAGERLDETLSRLARSFKVSTLVILRRLMDVGSLSRDEYGTAYRQELERLLEIDRSSKSGGGGDFYRTTLARVSQRFARALVESTLEGRTLYRDAFRMLGIAKTETFNELGRNLGVLL